MFDPCKKCDPQGISSASFAQKQEFWEFEHCAIESDRVVGGDQVRAFGLQKGTYEGPCAGDFRGGLHRGIL